MESAPDPDVRREAIVVVHRLSTVRRADRIAVLDNREVAASGTHGDPLAARSLYRVLCPSRAVPQPDAVTGTADGIA